MIRIVLLAAVILVSAHGSESPAVGGQADKILWQLDPVAMKPEPIPGIAAWVKEGPENRLCLRVAVPESRRGEYVAVRIPIDLTPWRGTVVTMTCLAKAQDVSRPDEKYNGVKCMLHFKSASQGDQYRNQTDVFGTFDWKPLTISVLIVDDASDGAIVLGLQDSFGTAWFTDLVITAK